ncbi:MAG: tRNA (guanosine(37)-N1)-methyltransferase TrmD, partial [Lachnospiraceae bacterium]|nr:tRNA (guanosine(37)-N1)-methyltransferase TrmD [Lachnospiraceae bacterium]
TEPKETEPKETEPKEADPKEVEPEETDQNDAHPNEPIQKEIAPKTLTSARVIYLTPQGRVFHQAMAKEFAREKNLIFLCGHYEGVDERVLDEIVTDQVSIGDYVLTGGELPAMVMMDAIARMVPGVLSNEQSGESESFSDGLLEYPQYSRPEIWHERAVPPVLLSGHHGNVDRWRRSQSLLRTLLIRPELLDGIALDKGDRKFLLQLLNGEAGVTLSEEQAAYLQRLLR